MERDDKQCCAPIGLDQVLHFDLLPPHYSGRKDRCEHVCVSVYICGNFCNTFDKVQKFQHSKTGNIYIFFILCFYSFANAKALVFYFEK